VNDHNHRHDEGEDVHEVVGGLEDEGVGNLNRPRVTGGWNARAAVDLLLAHKGA
jgi:hypothetical protein